MCESFEVQMNQRCLNDTVTGEKISKISVLYVKYLSLCRKELKVEEKFLKYIID